MIKVQTALSYTKTVMHHLTLKTRMSKTVQLLPRVLDAVTISEYVTIKIVTEMRKRRPPLASASGYFSLSTTCTMN